MTNILVKCNILLLGLFVSRALTLNTLWYLQWSAVICQYAACVNLFFVQSVWQYKKHKHSTGGGNEEQTQNFDSLQILDWPSMHKLNEPLCYYQGCAGTVESPVT